IDKLADVLAVSPGLVARLLGLANSAYFGQSRNISDLSTAIFQVLGLELVKSLSLGIVLNVQFDTGKCRTFNTEYFWMRSLLTALAAQKLAVGNKLQQFSPATIYTSGLLLYIGVLVLGYLIPEELNAILQRSEKNHTCAGDEIRLQLEESHYHLGYVLLQKWQLSPVYQSVLNHFEDAEFNGEEKPLINLLILSQRLSVMLLDNDDVDISELEKLCKKLSLSTTGLRGVVDELVGNRESIKKLAAIMGNR
ncbi:MAG: HDOD domain-containing protein, partial [Methylococcaceae bacterium]|nr:HDOD domain-containing protein [Methylococcaceae bacterium]